MHRVFMELERVDIVIMVVVVVKLWVALMMRLVVMLVVVWGTVRDGWLWFLCSSSKSIVILLRAV